MNQQTKKKIFDNLDVLGAVIMIVALFLGAFYKDNGGVFGALQYPGYRLIFNSDYMLGTLVIVLPLIVLITNYVDALKKYDKLIKLVLPAITLIFVFVLKGQVADEIATDSGAALSFALGGWIYILGNLIGLAAGAAGFFGVNLEKKADELISKKK